MTENPYPSCDCGDPGCGRWKYRGAWAAGFAAGRQDSGAALLGAAAKLRDGDGPGWAEDDAYADWLEGLVGSPVASCDYCGRAARRGDTLVGICQGCHRPMREPGTA